MFRQSFHTILSTHNTSDQGCNKGMLNHETSSTFISQLLVQQAVYGCGRKLPKVDLQSTGLQSVEEAVLLSGLILSTAIYKPLRYLCLSNVSAGLSSHLETEPCATHISEDSHA